MKISEESLSKEVSYIMYISIFVVSIFLRIQDSNVYKMINMVEESN